MQIPRPPHNWRVSPRRALAIQIRLAPLLRQDGPVGPLRYLAGVDAAFTDQSCLAGVVLWDREDGRVLESHTASLPLRFPYIPGLLTFREAPAIIAALRKLRRRPDVLLCDGQVLAHPRRCGLASHLGLLVGLPAVGCAKSRLVGSFRMPAPNRGAWSPLIDQDETVGGVLRTRTGVKPVFVSIGQGLDLERALALILDSCRGFRLPEPLRLADQLAGCAKRELLGATA